VSREIRIAPSILSADFGHLADEIAAVEAAGADWIHLDVMDGRFVPNLSLGPAVVEAARRATSLPLDVHLMIEEPDRYVSEFAKAGADTIGVHVETCPQLDRSVARVRESGARACVVLNPTTPAEKVRPVLPDVDQVLVMSVNPGFGGQSFIDGVLPKIAELRRWLDAAGLSADLEVDGGIATGSVGRAAKAGANVFVAGQAVFAAQDYARAIRELREEAAGAA